MTKKESILNLTTHVAAQLIGSGKRPNDAIDIALELAERIYALIDERYPSK